MNWYQKAKKSNDEHIKKLISEYEEATEEVKKIELKNALKLLCGGDEEEIEIKNNLEETVKEYQTVEKKQEEKSFSHTENNIKRMNKEELQNVINDCTKEIKRLESTRLKHETFAQKKELNQKIWDVRRVQNIARGLIYSQKMARKLEERKTQTSLLTTKRARFVRLFRMGISFSNMLTHPEGIKKEDMLDIVNDDVIKSCTDIDRHFAERWGRWVEVKLKQ